MRLDTTELARRLRIHAVRMTSRGGSSHVASILSICDILAVLYGAHLRVFPDQPKARQRDRFILSKGHAGAGVYAALAETGFFPISKLEQHYQNGSYLSGHVSHKGVPGVEISTGSLGHGLGIAAGIAYALRGEARTEQVIVLCSDGECDEGSIWEAALFAGHHRLSNLVVIVDYNKLQSLDTVENTLALEPFRDKWSSFRWLVKEIDGHNHDELKRVLEQARGPREQPLCVIAHTTKGRGVSFMENSVLWHYRSPQGDELVAALRELGAVD